MHWTADELYKYVKTLELGSSSVTPGPSPSGGDKYYVYEQSTPSDTWAINHNLGKNPSVSVVDSAGDLVEGDCLYLNDNSLILTFSGAFAGKAFLN